MKIEQLKTLILETLENSKARDIEVLDIRKLTDIADYMVVCTATSNRHSRTIAEHLAVAIKAQGVKPLSIEGEETGEWVLVDLGDIIVHILLDETRSFYSLEQLWGLVDKKQTQKSKRGAS